MALLFTPAGVNADDTGPPGGQTLVAPMDIGPAPPATFQQVLYIEQSSVVISHSETTKKVVADSVITIEDNRPNVRSGYRARSWVKDIDPWTMQVEYCDSEGQLERSKRSNSFSLLHEDCAKTVVGLW